MNLSVIIPNYEGEELLSKNLPKVLKEIGSFKDGRTEIIVVDDGSRDKSVEIVKQFSEVKLLQNQKNSGFSVTVNRGARSATGDILILLNTDVYPENDFLKPLLSHFKNSDIFAVGCMDKSIEEGRVVLRGRGIGKWEKGFLLHQRGEVNKSDTLWVSGGSGAFRKSIWDSLGGLNELYNPFYWEDIDLSYRALKSGYQVLFEKNSVVYHEHEKGAIKKKFSPFKVKSTAYRNQFIFVWTNLTDLKLIMEHLLWFPYYFIRTFIKLDFAFHLGFFKALILLPKIIKSRIANLNSFKLSDKAVTQKYQ